MKILFVQPYLSPGAGSSITLSLMMQDLAKKNEVAYYDLHKSSDKMINQLQSSGISFVYTKRGGYPYLKKFLELIRFVRKFKPDVVYGFGATSNVISYIIARYSNAKLVVSYRGMVDKIRMRKRPMIFFANKKANLIIAISDAIRDQLVSIYRVPPSKVRVIPPLIDASLLRFKAKNGRKLYYVGRLHHEKGVDMLIKALSLIDDKSLELHIIGDGKEREALYALTHSLNLADKVIFYGVKDDIITLLNENADLLIVPSRTEGLGRVVLESFAAAVPVVASTVGGLKELVKDNCTGFEIPHPLTPESIAETIKRALQDRKIWGDLVERGQQIFRKYAREYVNQANEAMLIELLGK